MQILYDNAPIVTSQGTALSGGTIKIHPRSAVSAIWGATVSIPIGVDGIPDQVAVDLAEGDYCVAYCPPSEPAGSRPTCDWIYSVTGQSPSSITPQVLLDALTSSRDYGRSYQELTAELTQLLAELQAEVQRTQAAEAQLDAVEDQLEIVSEDLTEAQATISRYEALTGGDLNSLEIKAEIGKIMGQGVSANKTREPIACPEPEPLQIPSTANAIPQARIREMDCAKPSLGALTQSRRFPKTQKLKPCAKATPNSDMDIHELMGGRVAVVPEVLKDCGATPDGFPVSSTAECDLIC